MPHPLTLSLCALPLTLIAESCTAEKPFIHQDRTLPHHVLLYLQRGQMEIIEDGTPYVLEAKGMMLLSANVHHWGIRPCAEGTAWTYVHFMLPQTPVTAESAQVYPVRHQEFLPEDHLRQLILPKHIAHVSGENIPEKLSRLVSLFGSPDPLRMAYLNPLLLEILLDLYALENAAWLPISDPVSAAILHLEKQVRLPFRANALAQACGLSYKYLCTLFTAQAGISPQQYHARLRMSEAARLLRETRWTISEISDRFGFCNPQYFSRSFAMIYHMPPREYRKRLMR